MVCACVPVPVPVPAPVPVPVPIFLTVYMCQRAIRRKREHFCLLTVCLSLLAGGKLQHSCELHSSVASSSGYVECLYVEYIYLCTYVRHILNTSTYVLMYDTF